MSEYAYNDQPGATLPPVPCLPPGGPAIPPPPCPLGGEYYYPRENWWIPYPQQSFALIPPWPRMPVAAAGPQGFELSPVAATAKWVNPSQIGIGGITAVAMGARGCPTPWLERTLYSRPKAADVQEYIIKQEAKDAALAHEQEREAKLMPPRWWPWG
jgi:hypothetical protein